MIQDIGDKKFNNRWDPSKRPAASSPVLLYRGGQVFLKGGTFPKRSDFPEAGESSFVYLFSIDKEDFFTLLDSPASLPPEMESVSLKAYRDLKEPNDRELAVFTGFHLCSWYSQSRYCGRCGAKTVHDAKERAMRCPQCGNVIYPRINPAVIVGVISRGRLLVTRYTKGYAHDALVAGFTEIGETFEQTVIREVKEETGLDVTDVRYYKSQPWGLASDILAGYWCTVKGDDTVTLADGELRQAVWERPEDITGQPNQLSLTNEMMCLFRDRKGNV